MENKIITYRDLRKIFAKEEICDLVMYKLLIPIEKTGYAQSWKFYLKDITLPLLDRLADRRKEIQTERLNELLANDIEHEWKITSSEGLVHRKGWKTATE